MALGKLDIINLVKDANFSSPDWRMHIETKRIFHNAKDQIERFRIRIKVGYLPKLFGIKVFDVMYDLDYREGVMSIFSTDVFREGRWVDILNQKVEKIVEKRRKNREARERKLEKFHSPVNDKWIFP